MELKEFQLNAVKALFEAMSAEGYPASVGEQALLNRQLAFAHWTYLSAILFQVKNGVGSRGSAAVLDEEENIIPENTSFRQKVLETRFNGNISLNYGLNQYAESLSMVYRNANRRQSVSIGFRIPVWQWGINRNKRKIAENTYEASLLSLETSIREFEDGIKENVHTYNHSVCLWQLAEASYRLAREQYVVAVKAFALGELSVYELTSARQKQNETMQQYYTAMKDTYSSYFRLRNLSLYDFRTEQDLEDVYIDIHK